MNGFYAKALPALISILLLISAGILGGEDLNGAEDWTVITCDGNLYMNYVAKRVVFFNNVQVENPRGSIRADRLIVYFAPDGKTVEKTEGAGHVRITSEGRSGRSEKIIYYPTEKKIVLIGDAMVTIYGNSVGGGMITFFLDSKDIVVEESPTLEYLPEENFQVDF